MRKNKFLFVLALRLVGDKMEEDEVQEIVDATFDGVKQKIDKRIGNEFWKARSSHGRKPLFNSPDELQDGINQYFQWCADYPLYRTEAKVVDKKIVLIDIPLPRATTAQGIWTFLDISHESWYEYGRKEGYSEVIRATMEKMFNHKLNGAAAGLFNANIIARDLGLSEKVANTHSDPDGKPLKTHITFIPVGNVDEPDK